MTQRPAQYLLRFDDLCPTMSPDRWQRFLPLLTHYKIKPILAIIPDNQDPTLNFAPPNQNFWTQMRDLQSTGVMIALHGFHHLCTQRGRSFIPLHSETEFAGASEAQQRQWIRSGLAILRNQGLNPRLFVAPRHGFDRTTLRVLKEEGINLISDGFARRPFKRDGMIWLPQQLWAPLDKSNGLWTICLHSNTASNQLFKQLESFLQVNATNFTSVDQALIDYPLTRLSMLESLQASLWTAKIRLRKLKKSITQ